MNLLSVQRYNNSFNWTVGRDWTTCIPSTATNGIIFLLSSVVFDYSRETWLQGCSYASCNGKRKKYDRSINSNERFIPFSVPSTRYSRFIWRYGAVYVHGSSPYCHTETGATTAALYTRGHAISLVSNYQSAKMLIGQVIALISVTVLFATFSI